MSRLFVTLAEHPGPAPSDGAGPGSDIGLVSFKPMQLMVKRRAELVNLSHARVPQPIVSFGPLNTAEHAGQGGDGARCAGLRGRAACVPRRAAAQSIIALTASSRNRA